MEGILINLGIFVVFVGGILVFINSANRNFGEKFAKNGENTIKKFYSEDLEKMSTMEKGNILGFGHWSAVGNRQKELSGVVVMDENPWRIWAIETLSIKGGRRVKTEGVEIPLKKEEINMSKSYYDATKKKVIFYKIDSKEKYFLVNTESTKEGVMEKFVQEAGLSSRSS